MEQPINQSVITLEGSGYDRRKKHLKLCKESAALCCKPAVSPDVSDRFTGLSFDVLLSNFSLFAYLLKI